MNKFRKLTILFGILFASAQFLPSVSFAESQLTKFRGKVSPNPSPALIEVNRRAPVLIRVRVITPQNPNSPSTGTQLLPEKKAPKTGITK